MDKNKCAYCLGKYGEVVTTAWNKPACQSCADIINSLTEKEKQDAATVENAIKDNK